MEVGELEVNLGGRRHHGSEFVLLAWQIFSLIERSA
jgi:hypothetical protein